MDAKSKANFINSVASSKFIVCSKCNTKNKGDCKFCITCGNKLSVKNKQNDTPAFIKVEEKAETKNEFKYVEPSSAFAEGLPEWSLEPPQIMVRRH